MKLLQVGQPIPYFSLPDQDGVIINFTTFLGKKILLYFYPKAMTPGCTVQACKLRDNMDYFKKIGIEIVGISTDTPSKLAKFFEKELLNFTLLSDENHQVSEQFGVWGEKKFMGKKYFGIHRTSFMINQSGIVEKIFENFHPNDHDKIILNYCKTNNISN